MPRKPTLRRDDAAASSALAPALPPGPRSPAIIQFPSWGLRPADFLDACARRYGDWFTVHLPASAPLVFFSDPAAVRDVVAGNAEEFRGGEAHAQLGALLGLRQSLILLDGEPHLRRRRLMLPAFHGDRMRIYGELIRDVAEREIGTWPVGRPFSLQARLQRISLEVILRAVFGIDDAAVLARLGDRVRRLLAIVAGPAALLLLIPWLRRDWGPLTPWGRAVRITREIRDIISAEITRRRARPVAGRADVLSILVERRGEGGTRLSDRELGDELITLLVAGHETTATSLAWACYHVLLRPEIEHALRREVSRTDASPKEHVGGIDYLDATIKETLRLSPVITEVSRVLRAPARVGSRCLPAGVVATPCIYLVHRRPDVWRDPERFIPERFLGARPSPFLFLPFGGGARRCIGAAFAVYEMRIVLTEIFRRVRLRLADGYRMRPIRRSITLAPSHGLPVVVERASA